MHGLAIDVTDEDVGHISSSTSTLANEELRVHELNQQLSTMAISGIPSKKLSSSRVSSTKPSSVDAVSPTSSSYSISSPTPLSHFPPDKPISPFCSPPILLLVGGPLSPSPETEPVSFFVHAKLLTRASTFFRSALSSHHHTSNNSYSFLEAHTRTISLPEDRPDDVRLFLKWLYHVHVSGTGTFPDPEELSTNPHSKPTPNPPSSSASPCCPTLPHNPATSILHPPSTLHLLTLHQSYTTARRSILPARKHGDIAPLLPPRPPPPSFGPLIRLYIFADRYQVGLGLADLIVDAVREMAGWGNAVPGLEDVRGLWGGTVGGGCGGMRRLVLDLYLGMRTEGVLAVEDEEAGADGGWDEGFLRDLVAGFRREGEALRMEIAARRKGKRNAGEDSLKKGDAGAVGKGEEGMVKVGRLLRNRCDYHHHHHHHHHRL